MLFFLFTNGHFDEKINICIKDLLKNKLTVLPDNKLQKCFYNNQETVSFT